MERRLYENWQISERVLDWKGENEIACFEVEESKEFQHESKDLQVVWEGVSWKRKFQLVLQNS